jgi:hypothetical protein
MFWLYILVPLIILFGAAGVINRRRRRSISGSESTAELARARAESTWREGRLSRHCSRRCLPGAGQVIEAINTLE